MSLYPPIQWSTRTSAVGEGKPVTIGVDDSISDALKLMAQHQVRRLPVIDDQRLVGIVSQADVARHAEDEKTGELVQAISAN